MDFTISENVYAGNAMNRRLFYQYGLLLPAAPHGYVGQGLGQGVSAGAIGLIAPNRFVSEPIEEFEVDGVRMIFQNTPNTEAPREMNTYIPDMKALWMAENVIASLHNIYTLRGAPVRDPLNWSKYIAEALYRFGLEAEVMFASHHWPRWGNARIQEVLRGQRDLYANMNNQVLHFANQGVTINQIHNVYEVPKSLQQKWHCRGYHGSPQHNARGVIQRYLGFWDCNPATLIPLSPEDSAPLYVEMMGGSEKILARGRELHDAGQVPARDGDREQAGPGRAATTQAPRTCSPTSSSRSATSRRTRACATASWPPPTSCAPASRRARPPISSSPDVIRAMSTRAVPQLPRHPHGQPQGRGPALHHQPRHARQWREVHHRAGERDAHQHCGLPGEGPRPDADHQPLGPRADHDGRRRRSRPRSPTGRRRSRATSAILAQARRDDGRLRSALRDHAGHQGAHDEWRTPIRIRPCRERRLRNSGGPSRPFKGRWLIAPHAVARALARPMVQ